MTQMPSVSLTPCPVRPLFIAGFIAMFLRRRLRQSSGTWNLVQTHSEDSPGQGITACKKGLQSVSHVRLVDADQEVHRSISLQPGGDTSLRSQEFPTTVTSEVPVSSDGTGAVLGGIGQESLFGGCDVCGRDTWNWAPSRVCVMVPLDLEHFLLHLVV